VRFFVSHSSRRHHRLPHTAANKLLSRDPNELVRINREHKVQLGRVPVLLRLASK
jgi:hypothetical protein